MQELITKLIAQGIPAKTAERMVKSLDEKPKTNKRKQAYAISQSASRKQDMEIEITEVCDCCGNTRVYKKTIKAYKDSPETQKVSTSICEHCPDYFRALTHEQLVSLALVRRHSSIPILYPRDSSQIKFAKKYSPEEIVTLDTKA